MLVVYYYANEIRSLHTETNELHKRSEDKTTLILWTKRIAFMAKFQLFVYGSGILAVILTPMGLYFVYHKRFLVLNFRLPYVDIEELNGFFIITLFGSFVFCFGAAITYTMDLVFVTVCFSGAAYLDSIRFGCKELSNTILNVSEEEYEKKVPLQLVKLVFRHSEMQK